MDDLEPKDQSITCSGVGVHHQAGVTAPHRRSLFLLLPSSVLATPMAQGTQSGIWTDASSMVADGKEAMVMKSVMLQRQEPRILVQPCGCLCVDLITSIASANRYLESVSGVWNRQSLAASFLSPDRVQRNQILKQGGFLLRSAPVPNLPRRHFYKSCSILQQFVTPHDSSIIRTAANAMSKLAAWKTGEHNNHPQPLFRYTVNSTAQYGVCVLYFY